MNTRSTPAKPNGLFLILGCIVAAPMFLLLLPAALVVSPFE